MQFAEYFPFNMHLHYFMLVDHFTALSPAGQKYYNLNKGNRIIKRSKNKQTNDINFGWHWHRTPFTGATLAPFDCRADNIYLTLRIRQSRPN